MNGDDLQRSARAINEDLISRITGEPRDLYLAAAHLIKHGGKRLRPHLVLKSCALLGGSEKDALPVAEAIEMIHNFTLVHDDIMDNDEMRHGVPTVHKKFGAPTAILAGDVLFSKAYETVSASGLPPAVIAGIIRRLAGACIEVCEGQMYDIEMAGSDAIPEEDRYIEMIGKKTAALFDASCALGAQCAGAGTADVENLSSFGRNLGIAFQITDDLIGVMGDPEMTRKPVGNDIREGKKSLPILLSMERESETGGAIRRAFGNPDVSAGDLREAVAAIKSLGIEKTVRTTAQSYASSARGSLEQYSGPHKASLVSLLDFVVERHL